jgi:hypothetical protein
VSPKLKALLARASLLGGLAVVGGYVGKEAPHSQTLAIRLRDHDVAHVDGVVTRVGDSEPTAGFSRDFPGDSAPVIRHAFSAPNGTYTVVINIRERRPDRQGDRQGSAPLSPEDASPIPTETTYQRQVSLVGGEVIVSPD